MLDDTVIFITSDHGENQGELGVIGDHATADHITSRVPAILRWPELAFSRTDPALHNQVDIAATIVELLGGEVPSHWDGRSFAPAFREGRSAGRPYVVFSQMAWSCMRAVRWEDYVFIHTQHTGLKNLPERMLFDIGKDPHELNDLAPSVPALAARGESLLESWTQEMLASAGGAEDPMRTVLREGGPYHTRGELEFYCDRLRKTGRVHHAEFLEKHPTGIA